MRNFRKAALAGATAVAVAFGSTTVAMAEETQDGKIITRPHDKQVDGDGPATTSSKLGQSSKAVDEKGNPTGADGRVLFGLEKEVKYEDGTVGKWDTQPAWARFGYIATIFLSVSAAVGLIVGPLYNFFVHGM